MAFRVYLLHMTHPETGVSHYVGIAQTQRLATRLQEHVSGNGALDPARVVAAGGTLHLARADHARGYADERAAKVAWRDGRGCPICLGRLSIENAEKLRAGDTTPPPAGYLKPLEY